jgi:hypothetical protein
MLLFYYFPGRDLMLFPENNAECEKVLGKGRFEDKAHGTPVA